MPDFAADPDYELRWPRHLLAQELDRLLERGAELGLDLDWYEEAHTLLIQAFASDVPAATFERVDGLSSRGDLDREPF